MTSTARLIVTIMYYILLHSDYTQAFIDIDSEYFVALTANCTHCFLWIMFAAVDSVLLLWSFLLRWGAREIHA